MKLNGSGFMGAVFRDLDGEGEALKGDVAGHTITGLMAELVRLDHRESLLMGDREEVILEDAHLRGDRCLCGDLRASTF